LRAYIVRYMNKIDKRFWTLPKLALTILGILLLFRIVYFALLPTGIFESDSYIVGGVFTFFADVPTILFLMIMSLVFYQWAAIYHFTLNAKKTENKRILRISLITANVIFDLIFIGLIIFYVMATKLIGTIITCSSVPSTYVSIANTLALIYKSLYCVLCITLSILLCIYAKRLVDLVKKSPSKSSKKKYK